MAKKKSTSRARPASAGEAELTVREVANTRFLGIKINPENFNADWDRQRGFFARVTACLLELDDKQLEARCNNGTAETAHAFMDMYEGIVGEIDYLKVHIGMLQTVSVRMLAVAHRLDPSLRLPEQEVSNG